MISSTSPRYREGNLPPSVNVHPDRLGPIIRVDRDGERELALSTWGMPTPEEHLDGKPDKGVTNIRKTFIPHWQQWLGVEHRCLASILRMPTRHPFTISLQPS